MPTQPVLCTNDDQLQEARAVDQFVAELQAGIDRADADTYNSHFAHDVLWGSPYGETVVGFDTLHRIHQRLLSHAVAGSSRYDVVNVSTPAPDVAVAHVRRVALDTHDPSVFSEMALYVLVRRDEQWWLAAGQNTIIRPKP